MKSRISMYTALLIAFLVLTPLSANSKNRLGKVDPKKVKKNTINTSAMDQRLQSIASDVQSLKEYMRAIVARLNPTICADQRGLVHSKVCRAGWILYEMSCFLFTSCPNGCSPNEAKTACEKEKAHLAKISSAEQQKFLIKSAKGSKYIIIGGTDQGKGVWRWPDGSLISKGYTSWPLGAPDGKVSKNCMYLSASRQGKWFDRSCVTPLQAALEPSYVCESPLIKP